jgi:hypothetical protein
VCAFLKLTQVWYLGCERPRGTLCAHSSTFMCCVCTARPRAVCGNDPKAPSKYTTGMTTICAANEYHAVPSRTECVVPFHTKLYSSLPQT